MRSGAIPQPPLIPIHSGGITLAVWSRGNGKNAVILHGGPGLDHHSVIPLGRMLSGQWRVLIPDLPGHGASSAPSGRTPGLQQLVEKLAAWAGGLEGGIDLLAGHSLGAWLARELLRIRAVQPRMAILLSPPAAGQRGASTAIRRAGLGAATGSSQNDTPFIRQTREEMLAHVHAEWTGGVSSEYLDLLLETKVRPMSDYRALLRNLHRRLAGPVRPFDPGCPVLVLCGESDQTTPPDQGARVANGLKGSVLEIVPSTGHYFFAEQPAATEALLTEFLRRNGSP